MTTGWQLSPWVAERRGRIGFALQVFPIDTRVDPARHLLAAGRLAEDLGFDALFLGDHPAWALECWVHLAALAVQTERIRLGVNVLAVPFRHPVLTARLAADLDNLSGGRLVLGLGIGWDANEFANLGLPFAAPAERQEALEEAVAIMRGVWGEEPFTYHGRHFQTTNARIAPAPVQRPALPLMIGGGGERVTLRQVAASADACNLLSYGAGLISSAPTTEAVRRKLAVLRRHCEELGRPYDSVLRTLSSGWLILAEDEAALRAKLQHYFPEGLEQRYSGPWRNFVVAGTPADAVTFFQGFADAGVEYFIVETLDAADTETIRLLAEQVVPRVKLDRL
ncbi:MAG TPA: TIGR03619 family F420-dependent LLM class oxidoreductase [Chloroflexota bacterium]|nr:TIGR03619 family F420-dependent LLM class oxidoreductase [Chloroflexota bacterium]